MNGSRFISCYLFVSAFTFLTSSLTHAQSTWVDSAGDDLWSSTTNWSTNASPAGTIVIFNDTGIAVNGSTVSSIVDGAYTISGLSFSNTAGATFYHRLQLAGELTINSALTSGEVFSVLSNQASGSHGVSFTGGGSLVINASGQNFLVQNTLTTGTNTMNLDLGGLSSFTATVKDFNVGYGNTDAKVNFTLAAGTNTITAGTMRFGDNYGGVVVTNTLKLGQTNTFNANTILIAAARASTTVSVQSGVTDPNWTIRGNSGGSSRADLILGINGSAYGATTGGSSSPTATVNLTGVSVDFLLDELVLGVAGSVASDLIGHGNGNLTVAQGTVDANSVTIGRALNITSQAINYTGSNGNYTGATTHGMLNISGGIFTAGSVTIAENLDGFGSDPTNATAGVNVNAAIKGALNISGGTTFITGDLTLATRTNATPSSGRTEGIATLTGGSVTVGGNITEGISGGYANNLSTLTLNGAVLDLTNGYIKVDTLNLMSGVLRNVSEINGGASVTKTTTGALILDGTSAFTGATAVDAGSWFVNGTHSGGAGYTVAANATLGGRGTVTVAGGKDITIATNGKLTVGDAASSAATLHLDTSSGGGLVFQDNSTLEMDFFTANTGGLNVSDLLRLDGTLTIGNNVSLSVVNSTPLPTTSWQEGDTWKLLDWSGVTSHTGTFSAVLPDLTGTALTWNLNDLYVGGTISLMAVPEPGRATLLLLALTSLCLRRNRRCKL